MYTNLASDGEPSIGYYPPNSNSYVIDQDAKRLWHTSWVKEMYHTKRFSGSDIAVAELCYTPLIGKLIDVLKLQRR